MLLTGGMIIATLLAMNFDLFHSVGDISEQEARITIAEGMALTVLLGVGVAIFAWRRKSEAAQSDDLKNEVESLRDAAIRDPLTGLSNRRAVLDALRRAAKEGRQFALFILDLNHFKRLNDEFGHARGDRVLEVVAKRLRSAARPGDVLARLGGDEFGLIAWDVDRDACEQIGARIVAALKPEIRVAGTSHLLGVSIGVALFPEDNPLAFELLEDADAAMYRAKQSEDSMVVFFDTLSSAPRRRQSYGR